MNPILYVLLKIFHIYHIRTSSFIFQAVHFPTNKDKFSLFLFLSIFSISPDLSRFWFVYLFSLVLERLPMFYISFNILNFYITLLRVFFPLQADTHNILNSILLAGNGKP